MLKTSRFPRVEVESARELRAWLRRHHARAGSTWLVTYLKAVGTRYVSRDEVLDELLCYGWVDGIRRKLDSQRTMQLISPRRTDAWTASYRARAERLIAERRMAAPGRRAIERAKSAGQWLADPDVDALRVPADLASALRARPGAHAFFVAAAPSYRRNVLRWIARAVRPPTRAARIGRVVDESARRRRMKNF